MVYLESMEEDPSLALFMLHHLDFLDEEDRVLEDLFANTTGSNEAIQYVTSCHQRRLVILFLKWLNFQSLWDV